MVSFPSFPRLAGWHLANAFMAVACFPCCSGVAFASLCCRLLAPCPQPALGVGTLPLLAVSQLLGPPVQAAAGGTWAEDRARGKEKCLEDGWQSKNKVAGSC